MSIRVSAVVLGIGALCVLPACVLGEPIDEELEGDIGVSSQAVLVEGDACFPGGSLDCYHVFECCGAGVGRLGTPIAGTCRRLRDDHQNCGACGNDCTALPVTSTCSNGHCCPLGQIFCDPECPDGYFDESIGQFVCNTRDPGNPGCYPAQLCFTS